MTPPDRDLILAAIAAIRTDVRRVEAVLESVLVEAKLTNGRVTALETQDRVEAAVKSRRRVWAERAATLATGAGLTVLAYVLNNL